MNTKTTPRDFFLHLGATVALFASVISIINLAFSIINYYRPDPLAGYFYAGYIAWPISMLIILIPVLYVLEYMIKRDIKKMAEKADLWIRRWRIYLTLFLTGATIIGDLIALVNVYLSGEISSRFIYKVLAVLVIATIVFLYYLLTKNQDVEADSTATFSNARNATILAYIGIVVVIVAIVFGFMVVGSPTKQRNLRFDNQRVSDLNNIQWQIINHWQQKKTLPEKLSDMNDSLSGFTIPNDPKTDLPYEYTVKVKDDGNIGSKVKPSFELCANFALPIEDNKGRGEYYGGYGGIAISRDYAVSYPNGDENWKHDAGRTCFTRSIDPQKYPVYEK